MRTKVAIVGAGPAGLMLGQLLTLMNISNVVVESRSKAYVEGRSRAGQITPATVQILTESGVGSRIASEGMVHSALQFHYDGATRELDFQALTGRTVTIYGQQEIIKDLVAARLKSESPLLFDAADVQVHNTDGNAPAVSFRHDGRQQTLECDFVVGCDGFHGICRPHIADALTCFSHTYPFAWLAVLAEMSPISPDVIFSSHDTGLALFTMRSPSVSRIYLQCAPDEDPNEWSATRIWELLQSRIEGRPEKVNGGAIIEKSIVQLRSFVAEKMQKGRLFLAGDAAHIVPPSAAKGLNLAVSDANILARAFEHFYANDKDDLLLSYSDIALKQVWRDVQFSHSMAMLLHRYDDNAQFHRRLQIAELDRILGSGPAAQNFAELWVGNPPFAASI
ncbi:4-hydroxybenzoate 3-monooxygenase [Pseudomonas neuropathica]|jgi:p-hydroxybenzoate 3-monooxygenase|uniref:4-hydroxybenzoate 3-monooxygenase n=1 Tax=Pseudomonas fluorescens group TaxID=136843 RepID=UPI000987C406|nr:4-hydroxybenzoate 3-monooxygenase [Pseudomonas koreensis]OOH78392.1 4-hydroxybenzoate 3-monooxygenase [Pseudomonas koreensis]WRH90852.1 4-hydroxybenzoate 3-monooxygenase [Pseudomonas fluorescens]